MREKLLISILFLPLLAVTFRSQLLEAALWIEEEYFPINEFPETPLGDTLIETSSGLALPGTNDSLLRCPDAEGIKKFAKLVGQGWSKSVYRIRNHALKFPNMEGEGWRRCRWRWFGSMHTDLICMREARETFLREIRWLVKLQGDPAVPRLFSYCAEADNPAIATELGQPITALKLLQYPRDAMLELFLKMAEFLARHPGLRFGDLRRQQFVLGIRLLPSGHPYTQPLFVDFDDVSERGDGNYDDRDTASKFYRSIARDFLWQGANEAQKALVAELDVLLANDQLTMAQIAQNIQNMLV
ncbi:unnamed protein product, partial [Mesorhabditis spiculigera]